MRKPALVRSERRRESTGALSASLRRRARARGVAYRFLFIEPDAEALSAISRLVDEGVISPVVGRVLPFEDTLKALEQVLAGGTRGKVLVAADAPGEQAASETAT